MKPQCPICHDWGFFTRDHKTAWCTCPAADATRANTPNLVSNLNSRRMAAPPPRVPLEKRITHQQIEAELQRKRKA